MAAKASAIGMWLKSQEGLRGGNPGVLGMVCCTNRAPLVGERQEDEASELRASSWLHVRSEGEQFVGSSIHPFI